MSQFQLEVNVTEIEKRELLTFENPHYRQVINQHPHLREVIMEDDDSKSLFCQYTLYLDQMILRRSALENAYEWVNVVSQLLKLPSWAGP